jgi:hypothetical protein
MLPSGQAPERFALVYGQAPYAGLHFSIVKLVRGILIVMPILQPSARASSSSSSAMSPVQDSADDYPEIGGSTCGDSTKEGCPIVMVALAGGPSHNSYN